MCAGPASHMLGGLPESCCRPPEMGLCASASSGSSAGTRSTYSALAPGIRLYALARKAAELGNCVARYVFWCDLRHDARRSSWPPRLQAGRALLASTSTLPLQAARIARRWTAATMTLSVPHCFSRKLFERIERPGRHLLALYFQVNGGLNADQRESMVADRCQLDQPDVPEHHPPGSYRGHHCNEISSCLTGLPPEPLPGCIRPRLDGKSARICSFKLKLLIEAHH